MLFAPFFRKGGFCFVSTRTGLQGRIRNRPPVRVKSHGDRGLARRISGRSKRTDLLSVPPRRSGSWQP